MKSSKKQIATANFNENVTPIINNEKPKKYLFMNETCEIGIDEAGRGPVLGPMVYGCCFWPLDKKDYFKKKYGFTDSKQLNEEQREMMFDQIKSCQYTELGYFTTVLNADLLSNLMLAESKSGGKNLNTISHNTAIDLINKVKALGVNVTKVILDTVGQPESYKRLLQSRLNDSRIEIIVESKADLNHPVVSASSICAKVTRDRVLADWVYQEQKRIDKDYGCGYPSDPKAKEWLKRNLDPVFGFPTLVRFSWKTCYSILEDHKMEINWKDDPDEKDQKKQQKLQFNSKKDDGHRNQDQNQMKSQKLRDNNKSIKNLGIKREISF
ncbi:ribonuclease h2 subunit a [Stylonychia lemnae]|uniref:Ribonuclease n=1 Tax=Stylonychia lemnae TaxID=5949 RepID=A0A078APD9_STYLE|nr:ribonuclease h2 subunit a [Stylonychia lemnae]|eukprot:CDW83182.1 ribonuclease h2 subunit a [Stylonychia lemnae]